MDREPQEAIKTKQKTGGLALVVASLLLSSTLAFCFQPERYRYFVLQKTDAITSQVDQELIEMDTKKGTGRIVHAQRAPREPVAHLP